MIRNYFADLELEPSATPDEIKQAYRRLARRFHPDLNPMDSLAEASFKRIQEAYDFLSSKSRVVKLKQLLEQKRLLEGTQSKRWNASPVVPRSGKQFVYEWREEKTKSRRVKLRTENLDIRIPVKRSSKEWEQIVYARDVPCVQCRGAGGVSRSVRETCKSCAGLGYHAINRGAMQWKKTCENCLGKGFEVLAPCSRCRGRGKIAERATIRINVPSRPISICLKTYGHCGFDGKQKGDLWIDWL